MDKYEKIKMLVEDFTIMFPNSKREERMLLTSRLWVFNDTELDLLVSQIETTNELYEKKEEVSDGDWSSVHGYSAEYIKHINEDF